MQRSFCAMKNDKGQYAEYFIRLSKSKEHVILLDRQVANMAWLDALTVICNLKLYNQIGNQIVTPV